MLALERRLARTARPLYAARLYQRAWHSTPRDGEPSSAAGPSTPGASEHPTSGPSNVSAEPAAELEEGPDAAASPVTIGETSLRDELRTTFARRRNAEEEQAAVDELWDRALRAPAAALANAPRTANAARSLLSDSTPSPRVFKGTLRKRRRAEGQTPHEAGAFNATLGKVLSSLVNKTWERGGAPQAFTVPEAARGKSLNALVNPPDAWRRSTPRVEDDDAALVAEIDSLKEELAGLSSPSEVVSWAERKVFRRDEPVPGAVPSEGAARGQWPRTYPRALASLINTLWTRLNAPHLALAMFEHARALGVESYLAGCQTSAYNELVRVHWEAFRDLNAVLAAVREMDAHAVAWDRYTAGFVGAVVDAAGREMLDARTRNATHRWGADAYTTLAALEGFLAADREREEAKFDRRAVNKRRARRAYV